MLSLPHECLEPRAGTSKEKKKKTLVLQRGEQEPWGECGCGASPTAEGPHERPVPPVPLLTPVLAQADRLSCAPVLTPGSWMLVALVALVAQERDRSPLSSP